MKQAPVTDSIKILGSGEAASLIEGINFSQVLHDFRYELAKDESAAFANQSTPDGQAWAPLAKATQQRKGRNSILVNTGALRASLVDVDGAGNIDVITSHELVYGTEIDYATFHETGTQLMPARPVIGMSADTANQLASQIADATAADTAPKIADDIGDLVVQTDMTSQ